MKKKEILFIGSILVFALVLWIGISVAGRGSHNAVRITVDGQEYGTYALDEDQTISINDTNICEIKDGKIFMTFATCPDQLCVEQHAIDERGGTIVCLPNKIVIEAQKNANISNTDESTISIDAVT